MTNHYPFLMAAALTLAVGCSEHEFVEQIEPVDPLTNQPAACIEVSPADISFDAIRVMEDSAGVKVVSVSNGCEGDLEIYGIQLADVSAPFQLGTIGSVLLPTGAVTDFTVTFDPSTAGVFNTDILIDNNDPKVPTAIVTLSGDGIAPIIDISPEQYDFGSPNIGCDLEQPYTVSNMGNADLSVTEFQFATPSATDFKFTADQTLPLTIAAAEKVDVFVNYKPLDEFEDSAYLTVYSNDPFTPQALVTATGTGIEYGDHLDLYEQPIQAATDILFTLDRSCSMDTENSAVISNFTTFLNTLSSVDADYHVTVSVDDSGCVRGSDVFIDGSFSASEAVDAFDVMANIYGSYGSLTEKGLALAEATLSTSNVGSGGCNEGFYRQEAFLSIVGISDEPDQSANTYSFYVQLFQDMKDSPDEFVYNAVAGDYPSGCGSASAGTGYYESTVATGGLFLSICAKDWASHLEVLAVSSVAQKSSFELSQAPVPETVEVSIDGVNLSSGWNYNDLDQTVDFETEHIPTGGSTIEIEYQLQPPCDT